VINECAVVIIFFACRVVVMLFPSGEDAPISVDAQSIELYSYSGWSSG